MLSYVVESHEKGGEIPGAAGPMGEVTSYARKKDKEQGGLAPPSRPLKEHYVTPG